MKRVLQPVQVALVPATPTFFREATVILTYWVSSSLN